MRCCKLWPLRVRRDSKSPSKVTHTHTHMHAHTHTHMHAHTHTHMHAHTHIHAHSLFLGGRWCLCVCLNVGDPVEFLSWLLNTLHLAFRTSKKKKGSSECTQAHTHTHTHNHTQIILTDLFASQ